MAERKDFDSIMRDITGGLCGDPEKDIAYLNGQMEKYKEHKMAKEILRACGRLIAGMIPEDKKEELARVFGNEASGTEATIEEVRFNMYKKDYNKALEIMEALVRKIEELNMFEDDAVSEYHDFHEYFEDVLYRYRERPEKDLRPSQIPYTEIYLLYGSLLVELNRIPEARTALEKGFRWNPVNFQLMSEYIETYKMTQDYERFLSLTKEAFTIAFRPADLARCYRNMGFWFSEKKLWGEAKVCYLLSLQYEKNSVQAQSELYYISMNEEEKDPEFTFEQVENYSEKYGFPLGPDKDIVGLAIAYGKHFLNSMETEGARYCLTIAYELTKDKSIAEILKKLPQDQA